jgi:hypothetical protein
MSIGYIEVRSTVEGWTQSRSLTGKGNCEIDDKGRQNSVSVGGEKNFRQLMTKKPDWDRPESSQPNQEKGHTMG